jgi:hypothetical protein
MLTGQRGIGDRFLGLQTVGVSDGKNEGDLWGYAKVKGCCESHSGGMET